VVKFRNDKVRIMVKRRKILCEMSLKRRGTRKRMRRRRRALPIEWDFPILELFYDSWVCHCLVILQY